MLHRRTTLVIDTENATKTLIKAKPAKAHEARRIKDEKDKQLEQVSKKAELEVRRFVSPFRLVTICTLFQYSNNSILEWVLLKTGFNFYYMNNQKPPN